MCCRPSDSLMLLMRDLRPFFLPSHTAKRRCLRWSRRLSFGGSSSLARPPFVLRCFSACVSVPCAQAACAPASATRRPDPQPGLPAASARGSGLGMSLCRSAIDPSPVGSHTHTQERNLHQCPSRIGFTSRAMTVLRWPLRALFIWASPHRAMTTSGFQPRRAVSAQRAGLAAQGVAQSRLRAGALSARAVQGL